MNNIIAKTLERVYIYIDKFNGKITNKNNINKLKIDSNKKPVIDTG